MAQMNLLDRVIAYVSPTRAARNLHHRNQLETLARHYEGGSHGQRVSGWVAPNNSAAAAMQWGLETLRARARDSKRNDGLIKRAHQVIRNRTVGTGIVPRFFNAKHPDRAELAQELWRAWAETKECDADGRRNFYGLQRIAMDTITESGSVLARKRQRTEADDLTVPLQIQVLEPDHLDSTKDRITFGKGDEVTLNGISFDKLGRRTNYWLYKQHPGDSLALQSFQSTQVPADTVAHVYWEDRKGQVDGVPWSAPVLVSARDFNEYRDAQLLKQKLSAAFVGFMHDISGDYEPIPMQGQVTGASQPTPFGLEELSPGAFEKLPDGKTVTFSNPPSVGGYREFSVDAVRYIALGFGIAYESLSGDYSQVNFASGRMGLLAEGDNVDDWRWHMLIPDFCDPCMGWFFEACAIDGHNLDGTQVRWTAPRRRMINPTEETNALKAMVRCGFTSHSEAVRELGGDPRETIDELAEDFDHFDETGVVLDSDPRPHPYSPGQQAQPPGANKVPTDKGRSATRRRATKAKPRR